MANRKNRKEDYKEAIYRSNLHSTIRALLHQLVRSDGTARSCGLTIDEIAKVSGYKPATVKRRLKEVEGCWFRTESTKNSNAPRYIPLVNGREIK